MQLALTCTFAVLLALFGCLLWHRQKRHARTRALFRRLVHIRAQVPDGAEADLARLMANLQALETEALDLLARDRVAADASMAIFLQLAQAVRGAIEAGYEDYGTED